MKNEETWSGMGSSPLPLPSFFSSYATHSTQELLNEAAILE